MDPGFRRGFRRDDTLVCMSVSVLSRTAERKEPSPEGLDDEGGAASPVAGETLTRLAVARRPRPSPGQALFPRCGRGAKAAGEIGDLAQPGWRDQGHQRDVDGGAGGDGDREHRPAGEPWPQPE